MASLSTLVRELMGVAAERVGHPVGIFLVFACPMTRNRVSADRDILLSTSSRTTRPSLCRQLGVVTVVEMRKYREHTFAESAIDTSCPAA
jgi:hypothetical protein